MPLSTHMHVRTAFLPRSCWIASLVFRLLTACMIVCTAFPFAAEAQESADMDAVRALCETMLCRPPGPVRLITDDGEQFETVFEFPLPIVQNGMVSIFPGETITVEAEMNGDRLVNLKAVDAAHNPEKTLIFDFRQGPSLPGMMLKVINPFPRLVKYHAHMMLPSSDALLKTSSCPVLSNGRSAFEAWPHAVFQLVLFDFRLLHGDPGLHPCEY